MERETNGFSLPHIFRILKVFQSNIDSLSYSNNYVCLSACSVLCYAMELCIQPKMCLVFRISVFGQILVTMLSSQFQIKSIACAMHTMAVIILVYLFRFAMALNWIGGSFSHPTQRRRQLKTIYHCLDMRKVTYFLVKPFRG